LLLASLTLICELNSATCGRSGSCASCIE